MRPRTATSAQPARRSTETEPGREQAQFLAPPPRCRDGQNRLANHRMMAGLLRCDPARLLKAAQPASVIPGHHIATSQVNVMVTPADRRHRWPQAYPSRSPHGLFAVLQLNGDSYLILRTVRRAERQPVVVAICAHVISDQPGSVHMCPCFLRVA